MIKTYVCPLCGVIFHEDDADRDEEMIEKEFNEFFPGENFSESLLVCKECFNRISFEEAIRRTNAIGNYLYLN